MRIPEAHKFFAAPMNEQRNWTIGLVLDDAQIFACGIQRPFLNFRKAMRRRIAHRVLNKRIVPYADSGVAPPIETLPHIAAIAQPHSLFQDGRTTS
jgi:hypothetical protein